MPGEHLRHHVSQGGGEGSAPSSQTSQFGRTASRTISPGAPAFMSRLARPLSCRGWRARFHVEAGAPSVEQDRSSPTRHVGAHRIDPVPQIPSVEVNLTTPQCLQFERGEPGEYRCCCRRNGAEGPHYPDGHHPVQPPDLQETAAAGHQVYLLHLVTICFRLWFINRHLVRALTQFLYKIETKNNVSPNLIYD